MPGNNNLQRRTGGADTMIGLGGNDTYYVDSDDQVRRGCRRRQRLGRDQHLLCARSSVRRSRCSAPPTMPARCAINLTGNEFAQTIIGNAGDNSSTAAAAAATSSIGFGGNDTYYSSMPDERSIEGAGGGTTIGRGKLRLCAGRRRRDRDLLSTVDNSGDRRST